MRVHGGVAQDSIVAKVNRLVQIATAREQGAVAAPREVVLLQGMQVYVCVCASDRLRVRPDCVCVCARARVRVCVRVCVCVCV